MKPGIKITVGSKTFDQPISGFEEMTDGLKILKRRLGDLTKPYDDISSMLLYKIKSRLLDNAYGEPPYPTKKSGFTRQVRRVRGQDPKGPALVASGRLVKSIHRVPSPTKNELGGQKEVFVLRIGTAGVPYAYKHLQEDIWEVPIRWGPSGRKFLDVDEIPNATITNEDYWGAQWSKISSYPRGIHEVLVPERNYLALLPEDIDIVAETIENWLNKLGE